MTREEATSLLHWLPDVKHSMCRRAWHCNYNKRGLYMVTIVVKERRPLLGLLVCDPEPRIELSPLGNAIAEERIPMISKFFPMVQVWAACIMPDHIHIILYVSQDLPKKKYLGNVVGGFKTGCTKLWWSLTGWKPVASEASEENSLFENNFNDRLIRHRNQLDNWKQYLNDNPRRLALKRENPELFTTLSGYMVAGRRCNIYGNRFLLEIPDKMAVVVHRRDSEEEFRAKCDQWLACGERGGVLVSAAIALREKAVMRIAMERGYSLILLRENGFPKLYKPSKEAFYACSEGRLLQISPWEYHFDRRVITREQCLELNALAEAIAAGEPQAHA